MDLEVCALAANLHFVHFSRGAATATPRCVVLMTRTGRVDCKVAWWVYLRLVDCGYNARIARIFEFFPRQRFPSSIERELFGLVTTCFMTTTARRQRALLPSFVNLPTWPALSEVAPDAASHVVTAGESVRRSAHVPNCEVASSSSGAEIRSRGWLRSSWTG